METDDPTRGISKTFAFIAWFLIIGALFYFFQGVLDKRHNPNQQLQSLVTSQSIETVLIRNRAGHYVGNAVINGHSIEFMLDTGATSVAVSERAARRLDLPRMTPVQIRTANGITTGYISTIDTLQLGAITLNQVPATIAPGLEGTDVLLGMSALKQLDFRQQGNELTLIQVR